MFPSALSADNFLSLDLEEERKDIRNLASYWKKRKYRNMSTACQHESRNIWQVPSVIPALNKKFNYFKWSLTKSKLEHIVRISKTPASHATKAFENWMDLYNGLFIEGLQLPAPRGENVFIKNAYSASWPWQWWHESIDLLVSPTKHGQRLGNVHCWTFQSTCLEQAWIMITIIYLLDK